MNSTNVQKSPGLGEIVIQPLPVHFDSSDYHIILFIKNHPEYESMEAMIKEYSKDQAYIRAIITYHNQRQVDHINDRKTVEMLHSKNLNRKVCYTPIMYKRTVKGKKTRILLTFTSFKEETVTFDFHSASGASAKHAGLIDPGGHSIDISLPVMYPEKTTLASPKSKILINGVKYKSSTKIWIPFLFRGMKGFFSEVFNIGVFRAGIENLNLVKAPSCIKTGEKWIYRSASEQLVYEIASLKDGTAIILGKNVRLTVETHGDELNIRQATFFSSSGKGEKAEFCVQFDPSLPILLNNKDKEINERNFSISMGGHASLITGKAKIVRDNGIVGLLLTPTYPEWAEKRCVSIIIENMNGSFSVNTDIINQANI